LLGCEKEDILMISAKTGKGVDQVLEAIIKDIPEPKTSTIQETRALIFDSYYDDYRGVILYVRVFDGQIKKNDNIKMMATDASGLALEVGALKPDMTPMNELDTSEIGYIVTNLKTTRDAKVGDTITLSSKPAGNALPGYQESAHSCTLGFSQRAMSIIKSSKMPLKNFL
jgi:GTP-binding protein LepA